ncbi:MAG TPA: hypothetical protein VMY35_18445 [Phycisphaerae bacterium]|nr:hypothetical protein [Phycisphaerae bacterium]
MPPTHGSAIRLIDGFLKQADADLTKKASNLDLAGDAKTTHPSANVDDKTKPAPEGARSAENEADVKKNVPNTINDAASENKGGEEEGATVNGDQGTSTMSADSGLKGNVDTPKKDHSKSMSDSGPGDDTFGGNWDKASAASALVGEANALLADVAMLSGVKQSAAKQPSTTAQTPAPEDDAVALFKAAAEEYPEDVEAGYVAASLLAQQLGLMKDAGAEDETAEAVAEIQKEAAVDAMNYVDYLTGYSEQLEKAAMPMGADPAALAALAGEGDAGGEMGVEEMAEGAEDEGGPEDVAEDALEGGEDEGGMGEEVGGDVLDQLAAVLAEAGIDPEVLAQALAEREGGGGGDEAGGAGAELMAGGAAPEVG